MRRRLPTRMAVPLAAITAAALIGGIGYALPRPGAAAARAAYVQRDGLHPNDAGYQALARGVDLRALR